MTHEELQNVIHRDLRSEAPKILKSLASRSVIITGFLGCGCYGSVYRAGNDRVLKIFSSGSDALVASKYLASKLKPAALPRYEKVWEEDGINYVLREDVSDLSSYEDSNFWRNVLSSSGWCNSLENGNWGKAIKQLRQLLIHCNLTERQRYQVKALIELVQWCEKRRLAIQDISWNNCGVRQSDGTIVVRDLSCVRVKRKPRKIVQKVAAVAACLCAIFIFSSCGGVDRYPCDDQASGHSHIPGHDDHHRYTDQDEEDEKHSFSPEQDPDSGAYVPPDCKSTTTSGEING